MYITTIGEFIKHLEMLSSRYQGMDTKLVYNAMFFNHGTQRIEMYDAELETQQHIEKFRLLKNIEELKKEMNADGDETLGWGS